jgi:hypothetical protein
MIASQMVRRTTYLFIHNQKRALGRRPEEGYRANLSKHTHTVSIL